MVDWPIAVSVHQYDEDESSFANAAAAISPDVAVYKFGATGTPGISDIDILLVVPDDFDSVKLEALASIKRSRLFAHGALLLPHSAWCDFHYFMPKIEPQWLGGPDLSWMRNGLSPGEVRDLALLECFEGAAAKWKGLQLASRAPTLPVRRLMLALWSVRHSVLYADLAGLAVDAAWHRYADDCAELRAEWSRHERVDESTMAKLLDAAVPILEAIGEASSDECLRRSELTLEQPALRAGGRTIVHANEDTAWRYRQWSARVGTRSRLYHELCLPPMVIALRDHEWTSGSPFGAAAFRRAAVSKRRVALAGRVRRGVIAGVPSLFESPAPTRLTRWMDIAALRRVTRERLRA